MTYRKRFAQWLGTKSVRFRKWYVNRYNATLWGIIGAIECYPSTYPLLEHAKAEGCMTKDYEKFEEHLQETFKQSYEHRRREVHNRI